MYMQVYVSASLVTLVSFRLSFVNIWTTRANLFGKKGTRPAYAYDLQYSNTTLFYYASHTQQKLVSVSWWGVSKHITIKYVYISYAFKIKSIRHGISAIQ